MLPEYKTRTNIGVGIGIILQIAGRGLMSTTDCGELPGAVLVIIGAVFFIWGCMNYAQAKGHSQWLGLLGLLSCIGLVILILLPDHYKESR